jgi:YD repeat-containing protein
VSTRVTAANGRESTVVVRAEYDSFGRVTQYTTSAGGSSSTTAFDYDEIGRLTRATYPAVGGLASAKERRWNDEARTVTRIDEEGRSLIEQYDQLGRLKRATYPDGTYATFYYDKDGRMTEARLFAAGGEPVCKTGAQYDARGRKTAEW